MTTTLTLAQRLLAANKDLGWVEKAGNNKAQGYDYTRAVDVFDRVRDVLNKHGIVWTFSTRDLRITVLENGKYVHALDGDWALINSDNANDVLSGTVVGSTVASGDKGTWVAITGMLKYAAIQVFLLPTGDDPEADTHDTTVKASAPKATTPIPAGTKVTEKVQAEASTEGLTDKQRAKLMATLRERGVTIKEAQQFILREACGKHSTKQMTGDDLDKVLEAIKDDELVVKAMASVAA